MSSNVTQKLIRSHLLHGDMKPGEEIGIRIDQTLDAGCHWHTGHAGARIHGPGSSEDRDQCLVCRPQYRSGRFQNADDHLFLRSACQRFGVWFSYRRYCANLSAPMEALQIARHDGWHGIGMLDAEAGQGAFFANGGVAHHIRPLQQDHLVDRHRANGVRQRRDDCRNELGKPKRYWHVPAAPTRPAAWSSAAMPSPTRPRS